jgi:hypothetical protein
MSNSEIPLVISAATWATLTTPDPDSLPLPNKNILDMQWTLQQVAALKGGGELSDDDDDDEDWEAVLPKSRGEVYAENNLLRPSGYNARPLPSSAYYVLGVPELAFRPQTSNCPHACKVFQTVDLVFPDVFPNSPCCCWSQPGLQEHPEI